MYLAEIFWNEYFQINDSFKYYGYRFIAINARFAKSGLDVLKELGNEEEEKLETLLDEDCFPKQEKFAKYFAVIQAAI